MRSSKKMEGIMSALTSAERDALLDHLRAGTSARLISTVLTKHGHQISATSVKDYRADLKENNVRPTE